MRTKASVFRNVVARGKSSVEGNPVRFVMPRRVHAPKYAYKLSYFQVKSTAVELTGRVDGSGGILPT